MHQAFYIDIDEEITSIVERLRHARASEIILVVPKRALLIQSIVNLRILKREADEARLQLMMVTQDKLGKILIEKAGIFVQQKMDNISDEEISVGEESQPLPEFKAEEKVKSGKDRLNTIGSSSYFDEEMAKENIKAEQIKLQIEKPKVPEQKLGKEVLTNRELVLVPDKAAERKLMVRPAFDLKPATPVAKIPVMAPTVPNASDFFNRDAKSNSVPAPTPASAPISNPNLNRTSSPSSNPNPKPNFQDKKIEDFFYQSSAITAQPEKAPSKNSNPETYNLTGQVHRWFWVFGVAAFLLVVGIGGYVFVPKAALVVSVKADYKSIDAEVMGKIASPSVDLASGTIPAATASSKQEVTESYPASGSGLVSNQHAHGTVTIYNEYSSSPQPLVATTRFLTGDGKLFRLVKGVTVPGTSLENGQVKKGEIEAEIVADQSGDGYNVGPSTFNIPGFKSSGVKYEKIYATSSAAMTGGGNGTSGASESKVITDNDIAAAKSKILVSLNQKLEEDMKKSGGDDALILDGAINQSDVVYKLSNSAGDVVNSFQLTASTEAKAIVVKQNDLKAAIAAMLTSAEDGKSVDPGSIKTDFSRADVDFANGTINIKFHATGKINSAVTAEVIKKSILGKNEEQVKDYLGSLPNIEKVEVNYWPPFVSGRIPLISSRVSVTLDPT